MKQINPAAGIKMEKNINGIVAIRAFAGGINAGSIGKYP